MAKTKQEGYYKLKPADKWLHFSMNCWVNLKDNTGRGIADWGEEYSKSDTVGQFSLLADLAFAALLSNDQENGNEIDYNIYKVRSWIEKLTVDDSAEFVSAMTYSLGKTTGKKQAEK